MNDLDDDSHMFEEFIAKQLRQNLPHISDENLASTVADIAALAENDYTLLENMDWSIAGAFRAAAIPGDPYCLIDT